MLLCAVVGHTRGMKTRNQPTVRDPADQLGAENAAGARVNPSTPEAMKTNPTLNVTALLVFAALAAAPLQAKLAWNKKARAYDAGITACTSCHVNEKPKKKGEPLSERGQWLVEQKEKRQAKDIDLTWLKDYPNNGK